MTFEFSKPCDIQSWDFGHLNALKMTNNCFGKHKQLEFSSQEYFLNIMELWASKCNKMTEKLSPDNTCIQSFIGYTDRHDTQFFE